MNENLCKFNEKARLGEKVNDFNFDTFNAQNGSFEHHSLNEYLSKGKFVVLFFYPGDFTFVCPTELADLANQQDKFDNLGAKLISISTDSKFTHLSWRRSEKLLETVQFQMGSDSAGYISRYFDVYDDVSGTAQRGTFIIDPDGVMVSKEVNLHNVGRNADELVRKLEASSYLRQNPTEACPARWKPGSKSLKPTEELVGNVHEALKPE